MKLIRDIVKMVSGFVILTCAYSAFANNNLYHIHNLSMDGSELEAKYLPVEKSVFDKSTAYSFIDRTSIETHPYNNLIRMYTQVTNYYPPISTEIRNKKITYSSVTSKRYANCDKKEFTQTLIESYGNYFGQGELKNSNSMPRRWETTEPANSKSRQTLTIVCQLPISQK